MYSFKILLLVVFTLTSLGVYSAQTEPALDSSIASNEVIPPKFGASNKTLKLSVLKKRMAALDIPAVSIAYMENDKISWTLTEGVIDFESKQEIDNNTVFKTTNLSKPVMSNAHLNYKQVQRVNLNSPLRSWQLPTQKWSQSSTVTANRLLGHTASSTGQGTGIYEAGVDTKPNKLRWYSTDQSSLAQLIFQVQLGKPQPTMARTLMLEPISKEHNSISQTLKAQKNKNAALPHASNGLPVEVGEYTYTTLAPAGLWTTPTDILRRVSKIQKIYRGANKSLISNKTLSEKITQQIESMGVGFFLEKQDGTLATFSDGGAVNGFRANLFIHAQTGDSMVIMTNSNNGEDLIDDLVANINEVYAWNQLIQLENEVASLKPVLRKLVIEDAAVSEPIKNTLVLVAEGEQF